MVIPKPFTDQNHVITVTRIDDVEHRQKRRLCVGRPHVEEYESAILHRGICGMPDVHLLADLRTLARHFDAASLSIEQPAVITTADALLLDAAVFERSASMRAMRLK